MLKEKAVKGRLIDMNMSCYTNPYHLLPALKRKAMLSPDSEKVSSSEKRLATPHGFEHF
jgi:hypothetical protein